MCSQATGDTLFETAVAHFAKPIQKHGAGQRISGLTLRPNILEQGGSPYRWSRRPPSQNNSSRKEFSPVLSLTLRSRLLILGLATPLQRSLKEYTHDENYCGVR